MSPAHMSHGQNSLWDYIAVWAIRLSEGVLTMAHINALLRDSPARGQPGQEKAEAAAEAALALEDEAAATEPSMFRMDMAFCIG